MIKEISIAVAIGLLLGMLIFSLNGCSFGGSHVENNVILCEPGSVLTVATDEKIDVIATTDDGKKALCKKNIAGLRAMPDTVYQQLRDFWNKGHPAEKPQ